jgi:Flp pilus assembly protein TadG
VQRERLDGDRRPLMTWLRRRLRSGRAQEQGYAAILVAFLVPTVFMACAAFGVDTANWYAQQRDMQKAADAAALAGVPYLPNDLPSAKARALAVASRNGYTDGVGGVTIEVAIGDRPTQLQVTINQPVHNTFGQVIGVPTTGLSRTAVADYQGPQPMGSPCNTFGNEPSQGVSNPLTTANGSALGSTPLPNCSSNPELWATIQGPQVDKEWGDRYQSVVCTGSGTENCSGGTNSEYAQEGYFWVVKVGSGAVGKSITLQLYDPAYVYTGSDCEKLPSQSSWSNNPNPYVTSDGKKRYGNSVVTSSTGAPYCTGDHPSGTTNNQPMITSFVLRDPTDTGDPMKGAVHPNCTMQFGSQQDAPVVNDLTSTKGSYDSSLAQVFHNWIDFCTFTPSSAGDYYIQVRDNVKSGGTAVGNTNGNPTLIWRNNPAAGAATGNLSTGYGDNSFGLRALIQDGSQSAVSVAGYDRMPMYANASGSVETFNLIRVLPGAAGSFINFSFYDIGDGLGSGKTATIRAIVPSDATGSITTKPFPGNCSAVGGYAGTGATLSNCTATISNTKNNAKVESMSIPVPTDYNCDYTTASGCWYRVIVTFPSGTDVSDITTWDATVEGDPVRLIK